MARRSAAYQRFMASTELGYERWHDGVPYDLEALAELAGDERLRGRALALARAGEDWRDIEALVALGSPGARSTVLEQLRQGSIAQRLAAARALPADPTIEPEREAAIVAGLAQATVLDRLDNRARPGRIASNPGRHRGSLPGGDA